MLKSNIQCSSVDLLEILAIHVQHRFAQANVGSTSTTRVHAFHPLLLSSKHIIMPRVPYLLHGIGPGHS